MTHQSLRLQARMNQALRRRLRHGSTLFSLTWKVRVTPALRPLSLLRASGRRTSDSGYGSWLSPTGGDAGRRGSVEAADQRALAGRWARTTDQRLRTEVQLAAWPTPTDGDAKSSGSRNTQGSQAHMGVSLTDMVQVGDSVRGRTLSGSPAETVKPGQLNPAFSRWLMGYPREWDDCAVMAMPSSRKSRPQ